MLCRPSPARYCRVRFGGVANEDCRVDPYAGGDAKWVVIMNETAFGGFEMVSGQAIWDRAEAKRFER